jgi:predicted lipoprotein with Yx(FWY)xxD motif
MKVTLTLLAVLTAVALAACGGSNDNGGGSSNAAATNATVSMDNGTLVDSDGAPLYTSEQEKSGKVVCTGGCTSIWLPLTAPGTPTAGDGVSGKLGTVKRPDGARQVTLDGRPLYRFAEDGTDGKPTGDGVKDNFGGQQFTWHLEGSSATASDSGGGGSSGGSYSY